MDNSVDTWMKLAENDYVVAEHLFGTFRPMPIEIICFHCQQAAEKAVKAVILSAHITDEAPKKHDISFLLRSLEQRVTIDDRYFAYADFLNPFGVIVRYPNELVLGEQSPKKALQYAKAILDWARDMIQSGI